MPLLSFTAIAFMLEAYFIGLKEGSVLRNASLTAFFLAFLPAIATAWYWHNVDLLWLALTVYMFTLTLYLGWQMLRMQGDLIQQTATTEPRLQKN